MKRKIVLLLLSVIFIPIIIVLVYDFSFFLIKTLWKPFYQTCIDDKRKMYIYALGESTTLGVHYNEKIALANLVSYQFSGTMLNLPISIVSLAESGQTIEYNYYRFYFETLFRPHQNALVLIYSGINEDIENESDPTFKFWKFIQHSTTLSKVAYMLSMFQNSPQKFEYRYLQLLETTRQLEYKTVISQLVGNIRDFDPEINIHDTLFTLAYKNQIYLANSYADKNQWKMEERALHELQKTMSSEHPYLNFRIGQCKLNQLQFDSAALYLNRVPEINKYLGYSGYKNKILERVANRENVSLARSFDKFADASEYKLVGYNLIDDAHHPNLKGYSIMSQEIAQKVAALIGDSIKQPISPETIIHHFSIDNKAEESRLYSLITWYMHEILRTEFSQRRLNRMKYYMETYNNLNPNDETQLLWETFISIFENNAAQFNKSLISINSSPKKNELIEKMKVGFSDLKSKKFLQAKAKRLKISNKEVKSTFESMFH